MSGPGRLVRVGLTGGIACGKSHVLRRLAEAGLPTLDLDALAHEATAPGGSAYADVVQAFGAAILAPDGSIDRKALGALVFADPDARSRLNALVHPRVREEDARQAVRLADRGETILVTDAALLVEAGVHLRFDRLVVVHCPEEEQLRRLQERDGLDEAAARTRLAAQMPVTEKRRFAHLEVDTSGSFDETDEAVGALVRDLMTLPSRIGPPVPVPLERRLGCLMLGPSRGPRGLEPQRLLAEIVGAGGLEMERVARLLEHPGPWYRAPAGPPEPGPEALAGPLVLWALARGAPDPPFLLAAAASLARLTHVEPASIAGACLFALGLQEVATSGSAGMALLQKLPGWLAMSESWAGEPPSSRVVGAIEAAARRASVTDAAPGGGRAGAELGALIGALTGMATGIASRSAPPSLVASLHALEQMSGSA